MTRRKLTSGRVTASVRKLTTMEARIANLDGDGIEAKWRWGIAALSDPEITNRRRTIRRRRGIVEALIAAATARGQRLSEREIRYRLECARAYPTEAHIRHARAVYGTWETLRAEGFPPVPVSDEPAQLVLDVELGGVVVDQDGAPVQTEIVLDLPDLPRAVRLPARFTLRQVEARLVEWAERHQRHAESIARHRQAADLLLCAVDGDDSATVADAAKRLREMGGGPGKPPLPPAT